MAFGDIDVSSGLVPAITLFAGERARMNFGHSEEPLRCSFAMSGFQPICNPASSLHYNIPLWYSAPGDYDVIDSTHHPRLRESCFVGDDQSEISKIEVYSNQLERARQECLKLNFGVTVSSDSVNSGDTYRPRRHTLPAVAREKVISSQKRTRVWSSSEDDIPPNVVSYSIVIPAGQDPEAVFVGWTTAGFRYIQSQFQYGGSRVDPTRHEEEDEGEGYQSNQKDAGSLRYGQQVKIVQQKCQGGASNSLKTSVSSYSTAFMVCLSDLLPSPAPLRLSLPAK